MIDWDRLTEVKNEIGEEDFADIAELFVEEIDEVMRRLAKKPEAATTADFHFLRGSAANLGFVRFAQCCADAETRVASGGLPDIDALTEVFEESLAAAAEILPPAVRGAA